MNNKNKTCPIDKFLIGKCRGEIKLVKYFIQFLYTHKSYGKFVFNYAHASDYWKNNHHDETGSPNQLMAGAFNWDYAPEGQFYWQALNALWSYRLQHRFNAGIK